MNQKTQSLLLGVITILCWGSLATFGNLLIHLPPFFVLGVTFLIGAIPALFRFRELFPDLKILVWGVLGYFGYHFFLFYAFRFAPAIEANLINYLWPVIMVILTPVFFPEERLRWYHLVGGVLAVTGCVFLVSQKGVELRPENFYGYVLALLAAITWPVYSIGKKKMKAVSVWAIGGFCLVSGILCLLVHAAIEPHVVLQPRDAILLSIMGIGPFGLAFYTWDLALRYGDAKLVGALAYLTPVLSTTGLILFVGEGVSTTTWIAMVLIIGGASAGLLDFYLPRRLK